MTADDTVQALAEMLHDQHCTIEKCEARPGRGDEQIAQAVLDSGLVVPAAPATGEAELRERIAEAAADTIWRIHGPQSTDRESAEMDGEDIADAVMAVVAPQAALDAAVERAELAEAESQRIAAERDAVLDGKHVPLSDLAAAWRVIAAERQRLDQVRRELAIERINPDDHAGSENWSEACYEVQAHDECDDPDCRCPCHTIALDTAPADETGGAT